MQNAHILNLGPAPSENVSGNTAHSGDGLTQADLIEQTQSDVRKLRMQIGRQEDAQESHARRTKILSVILAVLVVILIGAFWFVHSNLRDQKNAVVEMLGLQTAANALGERVNSVEAKFDKATAGLPALTDRMDQLQASMKSTLQTARTQAQAAATQVGQKIRADLNLTVQAIQSRVAGVESNQREASERVNQLQEQIAGLKGEIATMREESSTATERIKQLQDEQQVRTGALTNLDQRMASHQASLDFLANRVDLKRIDFEIQNRRTEAVAPGIYLTIRRTDPGKQEVDGTLRLAVDSQMLAIRGQGIRKPMLFTTSGETRPVELVFTQVAKNRVSGYAMIPAPPLTATKVDQIP